MLKLLAIAASFAVLAFVVPSASAHTVPVQRPTLHDGLSPDVAQAIQASGFAEPRSASRDPLPNDTSFDWGDGGIGVGLGAVLTLVLLRKRPTTLVCRCSTPSPTSSRALSATSAAAASY